jgi:hypothetical protein
VLKLRTRNGTVLTYQIRAPAIQATVTQRGQVYVQVSPVPSTIHSYGSDWQGLNAGGLAICVYSAGAPSELLHLHVTNDLINVLQELSVSWKVTVSLISAPDCLGASEARRLTCR